MPLRDRSTITVVAVERAIEETLIREPEASTTVDLVDVDGVTVIVGVVPLRLSHSFVNVWPGAVVVPTHPEEGAGAARVRSDPTRPNENYF